MRIKFKQYYAGGKKEIVNDDRKVATIMDKYFTNTTKKQTKQTKSVTKKSYRLYLHLNITTACRGLNYISFTKKCI